jgi:hypothetical protein
MRCTVTAAVLIAAIAATGCGQSSPSAGSRKGSSPAAPRDATPRRATPAGPTRISGVRVFSLLADRRLLALSADTGKVEMSTALGPKSPTPQVGRFLALSGDARTLYVLVPWTRSARQVVTAVDPAGLQIRARFRLPRGVAYRSLVAGSKSGRLYVAGNRPAGKDAPAPSDAVVTVLDPASRTVLSTWTVRNADGHFWWVLDTAVSEDERRLYVSYHGGCDAESDLCTTGADRLDIRGKRASRCQGQPYPHSGCLGRVHGQVATYQGGVVAATGEGPIIHVDGRGRLARAWKTEIPGNHLMQFALDRMRRLVYAIGSCGYRGGLSRIELATGTARVTGYPSGDICGERIVLGPGSLIVVASNPTPVPQGGRSTVLLVDASTGDLIRSVATPVESLDLVSVRRAPG